MAKTKPSQKKLPQTTKGTDLPQNGKLKLPFQLSPQAIQFFSRCLVSWLSPFYLLWRVITWPFRRKRKIGPLKNQQSARSEKPAPNQTQSQTAKVDETAIWNRAKDHYEKIYNQKLAQYIAKTQEKKRSPFQVFGLSQDAIRGMTEDELKTCWRSLLRQFHPDKIVSLNLPHAFGEFSTQRTQEINQSYQKLLKLIQQKKSG